MRKPPSRLLTRMLSFIETAICVLKCATVMRAGDIGDTWVSVENKPIALHTA